MKGIVLAGGSGTRLYPLTRGVSKQLLPLYDKPMIFYPIATLMLAGIRDILIITTLEDQDSFKRILGDGSDFGVKFTFEIQDTPKGLAEAFIIGEEFIGGDSVCLVLGDNIFYGQGFPEILKTAAAKNRGATVFGYRVKDPERFGVVEFDKDMRVDSIEEKPLKPKSNYAVTGLYFYDNSVIEKAKLVQPSTRGELEITTINQMYLQEKKLDVELLGRGFAWLDTGTHESLHEASNFVQSIQHVQGLKIACLEEIAWRSGWLTSCQVMKLAKPMKKNDYGIYLLNLVS
ncbi:glucose-1-phosphate thymidylyltransferase RfbA [Vibrio coralliirubri]|uniref:glucose-1-phosphate thymidylyltransferase RfbA n=1 Tax=Vibrio coralliirubri TaxID=1516159 RepID=UPI002FE2B536